MSNKIVQLFLLKKVNKQKIKRVTKQFNKEQLNSHKIHKNQKNKEILQLNH